MNYIKLTLTTGLAVLLLGCQAEETGNQTEQSQASVTETKQLENLSPVATIDLEVADEAIEEEIEAAEEKEEAVFDGDLDYTAFDNVEQLVWHDIESYGLDSDLLSISYYDFMTQEEFHLNADIAAHGASTNKVGTAVLYMDLINQGELSWESYLPFSESWIEDGAGEITASPTQASYEVYELIYQSLFHSDNTAWNTLINNYYSTFGDFQADLIALSGQEITDPELYNLNFATSRMLNEILIRIASDESYQPIVDIMLEAQEGIFLKMYVSENMAAKYGQYEEGFHDTGIYYDQDEPGYTIAVMSHDLGPIDYFLGDLNLHLKEYRDYQQLLLN